MKSTMESDQGRGLISAATLSHRYIRPVSSDKAIDLIDEAAAQLVEINSMPTERMRPHVGSFNSKLKKPEKEKEASRDRLEKLSQVAELQSEFNSLKLQWEKEKSELRDLQGLKQQIEETRTRIEQARGDYNLEKQRGWNTEILPDLEKQLTSLSNGERESKPQLSRMIRSEDIAEIVSRWTASPGG